MYNLSNIQKPDILNSNKTDICFYNSTIIKDPYSPILANGAICISKNYIQAIGTTNYILKKYPNALHINANGFMIIPGLINAHTHVAMGFFRGLGHNYLNKKSNTSIIETLMFPLEKALTPELVEPLSYSYIYEGIKSGTTCFVDHYYFIEGIAKALKTFGARGVIGETLADIGSAFPSDSTINKFEKIIENWDWDPLIMPCMAPHAADTVSKNLLTKIVKLAQYYDLPIHMHLSQSRGERIRVLKRERITPVKYAYRCGALGPKTLAVHLVSADNTDLEIIKKTNTTIGLCPISEIIYETLPNIKKIFSSNIPIVVGTDCAASNDGADILNEIKFLNLICKYSNISIDKLKHEHFLNMVTKEPTKVLGLKKIGSLNQGNYADLIFIKQDLQTQPAFKPLTNLLYSSLNKNITHVMINGKWVLYNKVLVTISENTLMKDYDYAVKKICTKAKITKNFLNRL